MIRVEAARGAKPRQRGPAGQQVKRRLENEIRGDAVACYRRLQERGDTLVEAAQIWTYSYDNEGNLTKKSKGTTAETWYYGYDNRNHLTSAKQEQTDGGTLLMQATYVYDALGNRLEKDVYTSSPSSLTVTRFGYDGQNVWADLNGTNQLQMRRLYLDTVDSVFARIDSSGNAGWYLPDHLGSTRVVMNSANTTTDVIGYDAFGNVASESNSSFGDRYKWTGREFDSETGLQCNRSGFPALDPGDKKF